MRVKALQDHFNDYSLSGSPGAAVGNDRHKTKGVEYEIADEREAKALIDSGVVGKVAEKKSER